MDKHVKAFAAFLAAPIGGFALALAAYVIAGEPCPTAIPGLPAGTCISGMPFEDVALPLGVAGTIAGVFLAWAVESG